MKYRYIFPFKLYDDELSEWGIASLNLVQAHLTLALAAFSMPPPISILLAFEILLFFYTDCIDLICFICLIMFFR